MIKYNFKSTILILALATAFVSCGKNTKTEAKGEEEILPENIVELREDQIKLANIVTGSIEMRLMSGTLKVNGTIGVAPQNFATVCMPMGGFVKTTNLVPGNSVSKGQVLAVLENQDFVNIQQSYLEAKNKFEFSKAEYERQSELYKNDVSSQKNMQQVTSDYKSLKVEMKALQEKLALIGINPFKLTEDNISRSVAILSPISGYVKAVNVSIGKSVSGSDILFEIVNSDKLFLELSLFEKDVDKVTNGQKIRFLINNETEQHEAIIYQTGKLVNNDKTYKVYANISNSCKGILPGMYVNALIETTSHQVTTVASEAIVSYEDKDYIFIFEKQKMENGKSMTEYRMVQIQKGVSENGYTAVILPKDLNIKMAKVVVKGAYNLLSAKKNAGEMSCG